MIERRVRRARQQQPHPLGYELPPRPAKLLGHKPPTAWDRIEAVLRMGFGFLALAVGVYCLAVTVVGWPNRWMQGAFIGLVALLAGFVMTVRPLWRLMRSGPWWKLE
jgi:hypothetical protein